MPKTIIIRQTYHCTGCRYESDVLVGACRTQGCTGEIFLETDPTKCGTFTVIGDEDIEKEIGDMQTQRVSKGKAEYAANVIADYRAQRRAEKDAAITAARIKEKK